MEVWQAIGNLSPGVAVGALAMFYYNQLTIKYLDERREWLQSLAEERRGWNETLTRLTDRYDTRLLAATEAITAIRDQMHTLRGDIAKVFNSIEARLASLASQRGGNGDD